VNATKLATIEIPIAPAAEQTRIVEKLEELLSDLDAGVAELKAAQRKLAQYRQSLLKAAVEGALTQDWRARHTPRETGAELLQRILRERRARWEQKQLAKFAEQGKTPPKDWRDKYPEPVAPDAAGLPALPEGWVWASLEQVSEIQGGIQKQPTRAPVANRYPFLRVANVARGRLKLDDVHEIELFEGELDKLALKEGDVLVVEGNGSRSEIGRCAVWNGSIANAVHQNHLIRARPVLVAGEFVATWLNSLRGIEHMTALAATTSGLYTLSVGKISRIPVPLPPLDEQVEIRQAVESAMSGVEDQEAATVRALQQAAAQRKNLLRAAFAGQLVPQDPRDEPASELLARIRAARAGQDGKSAKPRGRRRKETV
jgi:type I restriction enzyme S subunit